MLRSVSVDSSPEGLRKAIEQGNYDAVRRLITRNRYLVHCNSGQAADRPIHVAAQAGHRRIVELLLHYGADPNVRNADRRTPAHLCVLYSRHRVVRLLFDRGADSAAVDRFNYTPLEMATIMNKRQCVDTLLNRSIPENVINKAFFKAMVVDNTILMNKLLNRGADIEYVEETKTQFTVLLMAVKMKNVRSTQFLLEKGANPAVYDPSSGWTCLHFAINNNYPVRILSMILDKYSKEYLDFPTHKGETALHFAAKMGNKEATLALVRAGANLHAVDYKYNTPLLNALHRRKDAVSRVLVCGGTDLNRCVFKSPLHMVVKRENLSLTRLMLEHGAVVADPHNLQWTIIHSVCESGNAEMLACLLAYLDPGVLYAMHDGGQPLPPLLVAASQGHVQTVDVLLGHGVDVNTRCESGQMALHVAIRSNNAAAMVDRLLDSGACIDARNPAAGGSRLLDMSVYTWGRRVAVTATIVHSNRLVKAVVRHDVDAVEFLLACGVSPNMTTSEYGTPLHVAVRNRKYRMVAILLSSDRCQTSVRYNGVTPLDYALAMGDARATRMIMWRDDQRRRQRTRHQSLAIADRTIQPVTARRRHSIK